MQFDVLTIFPGMFAGPLTESILKRGQEKGLIEVRLHDLRQHAHDRHRQVDDTPYGGGGGMVLMPGPLFEGVESIQEHFPAVRSRVILLSPQGRPFSQERAGELARDFDRLILICGRYEGVDERVREFLADEELSIGDYVLTGGELPAMVVIDAVSRQVPGVLGSPRSVEEDSFFAGGGLEYPQYTKPAVFRGMPIPEVLLSGNHAEIVAWRRRKALEATESKRPDLTRAAERITGGK
ncbi:MAG: tRNA (guanosine(37)-N1)-methyltransferase TrmD [Acidobacteria bacterium]|nr:tRNA (guanosine(37)-N1)-methyltransferase TrmD [Acidobacteriota bacterium]